MDACLYVGPVERARLERLIADGKTPQKIVKRASIVLLSGQGHGTGAIERQAGVSKPTVWRWQQAYMDGGLDRLLKDKGKGPLAGKKRVSDEVRLQIVMRTAKEKPKNATHWSARLLAEELGIGHTTVQRVWKEHGLKPSDALVQTVERSQVCREGGRHCRALSRSAGQGGCAVR